MRRLLLLSGSVVLVAALVWFLTGDREEEPARPAAAMALPLPSTEDPREWARPEVPARAVDAGQPAPTPVMIAEDGSAGFEVLVLSDRGPLRGAEVRAYLRGPTDPGSGEVLWRVSGSGLTGEDGRLRLTARPGAYLLTARWDGRVIARIDAVRPEGEELTHVRLIARDRHDVRGTVVERRSGEPVPLAEVVLTWLPAAAGRAVAPPEERLHASADPNGHFHLAEVPEGRYQVEASAPGMGRAQPQTVRVPGAPLRIELGGAGTLQGYVVEADGTPAIDAEVQIADGAGEVRVRTGTGGGFAAEVAPGRHTVFARAGTRTATLAGAVAVAGETRDLGTLRLGSGAVLEGVVRARSSGAPIGDALIVVRPDGAEGEVGRGYSGLDGRFRIDGQPGGSFDVTAIAAGYGEQTREGVTVASGGRFSLELLLDGTGAVVGTVLGSDGAPSPGVRVRGGQTFGGPFAGGVQAAVVSDSQGRFHLRGLATGEVEVEALLPDGTVGAAAAAEVEEGGVVEVVLRLTALGQLRGRVIDERAIPVPFARVFVMETRAPFGNRALQATEDGRFEAEVPVGTYRLVAVGGEGLSVADDDIQTIEVGAARPAEVELLLRSAQPREVFVSGAITEPWGAPAAGAFVAVTEVGQPQRFRYGAYARADGTFAVPRETSLADLPAFDLQVIHDGRSGRVQAVPAGSERVAIRLVPAGAIAGELLAAPLPRGYHASALPEAAHPHYTPPRRELQGRTFTLTEVPAGWVRLQLTAEDGRTGEARVEVRPGETVRVTVALAAGETQRRAGASPP